MSMQPQKHLSSTCVIQTIPRLHLLHLRGRTTLGLSSKWLPDRTAQTRHRLVLRDLEGGDRVIQEEEQHTRSCSHVISVATKITIILLSQKVGKEERCWGFCPCRGSSFSHSQSLNNQSAGDKGKDKRRQIIELQAHHSQASCTLSPSLQSTEGSWGQEFGRTGQPASHPPVLLSSASGAAFSISTEQASCSAIPGILCSPNCDILGLFGRRWGWAGVERTPECSRTDIWCLDFAGSRDRTINPLTLIAFLSASISSGNKMPLQLMENEPPMR